VETLATVGYGDMHPATLYAHVVATGIIIVLSAFVWFAGKWSNPFELPGRTWLFLGLSGLATGASWVCYFRALQLGEASTVAPVDKMSLVLVTIFAFTLQCCRLVRGQLLPL
jgi:transporter family protein